MGFTIDLAVPANQIGGDRIEGLKEQLSEQTPISILAHAKKFVSTPYYLKFTPDRCLSRFDSILILSRVSVLNSQNAYVCPPLILSILGFS